MDLLILLARSGGRLLSREEIIEHLWGKNPWLDSERNLNTAIGKLRRALGDNVDQPRFIETVVGKGYRFIVPAHQPNGSQPSSFDDQVRFELIRASEVAAKAPVAPMPVPRASDRPGPTAVGVMKVVVSAIAAADTPRPGMVRGSRLRWGFSMAGATVAVAAGFLFLYMRHGAGPVILQYQQITSDEVAKNFNFGGTALPILTDSTRLYYPVYSAMGKLAIGQVADVGGEAGVANTSLSSPVAFDISPDGSKLLVASPAGLPDAPLWVQPMPEGQPHRVGQIGAESASWSPDGRRIAYSTTSGLFTVRNDGTDVRRLVGIDPQTGKQIYWPRWSLDASQLRYSLYDPHTGYRSLWQVNADGTRPHGLLPGWNSAPDECCGSWTPDGKFFVFASTRNGRSDIWAIAETRDFFHWTSGKPFQLTAGPVSFSSPLPASHGRIFVAGTENRGELARWDPKSKMLERWFGGGSEVGVNPSLNGQWLAYTSFPGRTLWRSRADGTAKIQLTMPPMEAYLPRWSPDGAEIAFYARTPGAPFQIYIVSANGGKPYRPIPGDRPQIDPTWSKNGRELMFESDPWQERGGGRNTQIKIVDLRSRKSTMVPGSAGLVSPRWSPDGRWIAAMPANSSGLVLFNFETQRWTRLVSANIGYPNWSHDCRYIYFDWFSSPAGVRRIRVADHDIQTVVSRQPGDELWTSDDWTGLTRDDSVLLLRDVSIQEIYAIHWPGE